MLNNAIESVFPEGVLFGEYFSKVKLSLEKLGFSADNTLLANCICRDEINKTMLATQTKLWGQNFELSGLAGYPTSGITAFTAYSQHVPENGHLLVIHGAHIGVDCCGVVGMVQRAGMENRTTSCGSLALFIDKISQNPAYVPQFCEKDSEQFLVETSLIKYKQEILADKHPLFKATTIMYEMAKQRLVEIIRSVKPGVVIALIGGIMINTDVGYEDYWLPLDHRLMDKHGNLSTITV